MRKSKTGTFLLVYTLYLVGAILAYVLFYLHIDNQRTVAAETTIKIEELKQQNNQMNDLIAMVRDTEEGRERISSFFVDSEEFVKFLETIESLGDISRVEVDVKSISDEKVEEGEKVQKLNLSLDFSGSWTEVHHFLVLLESMPIKMAPERLSLNESSRGEEEVWKGSIFFSILLLAE